MQGIPFLQEKREKIQVHELSIRYVSNSAEEGAGVI